MNNSKLKASQIYSGTSTFIAKKMIVGFISALIILVPTLIAYGVGSIFSHGAGLVAGFGGLVAGVCLSSFFERYFGYQVKAAHIAVITETLRTGQIPENQFQYGVQMVKENFAETNVYFVIDSLISKAVREIQEKMEGFSKFAESIIPNAGSFIQYFIKAILDYIDECCLGYTFLKKDEDKFKASCDGIVIYFQNWKDLLKAGIKPAIVAVIGEGLIWFISFVVFAIPCKFIFAGDIAMAITVAVVAAIVVTIMLKGAIIDTYTYICIMQYFMEHAMVEQPSVDIYEKCKKWSKSFKKLLERAGNRVRV